MAENVALEEVSTAEAISELRCVIAELGASEGGKRALELLAALERRFDEWSVACRSEARDLRARLEHISRLAATDDITGLANRRTFDERMRGMGRCRQGGGWPLVD